MCITESFELQEQNKTKTMTRRKNEGIIINVNRESCTLTEVSIQFIKIQLTKRILIQRTFYISTAALFLEISSILSSLGWHRRLPSDAKARRVTAGGGPGKNEKSRTRGYYHPPKIPLNCSLTLTTAQ